MKKLLIGLTALAGAMILVGCGGSGGTAADTASTQSADTQVASSLATCLGDKGWKMYGTERCGHCKKQKEAFGDAFASVEYIDCDANAAACTQAGIEGYPTWVSGDGQAFPGGKELDALKTLAQC